MDSPNEGGVNAELTRIVSGVASGVANEYLKLAPEMQDQFDHDVMQIKNAMRDYCPSTESVFHSSPYLA